MAHGGTGLGPGKASHGSSESALSREHERYKVGFWAGLGVSMLSYSREEQREVQLIESTYTANDVM